LAPLHTNHPEEEAMTIKVVKPGRSAHANGSASTTGRRVEEKHWMDLDLVAILKAVLHRAPTHSAEADQ
jgi:hypothetical protein